MANQAVKVLQIIIGGKTFSGVASYLYQYYRYMDHSRVQYDFLFCRENSMELVMQDPAMADSKFYVLNAKKENSNDYAGIVKGVNKVLREQHYDAVVVNTSIIAVIFACLLGMKGIRDTLFIAHAHNTDLILGKNSIRAKLLPIMRAADNVLRAIIRSKSDYLFGCSEEAGVVTFGRQSVSMDKFHIIHNAIDTELFAFDHQARARVRAEQGAGENTVVYGNVGSFCKRKNQLFLLEVFKEILKQQPDSQLWLIGDGADRAKIEQAVWDGALEDKVRLLGQRSNVNELMSGMDSFVFTTLSEGLGIVAIEAQATGLTTFITEGVPVDVMVTEQAHQLQLSQGAQVWGEEVLNAGKTAERTGWGAKIAEAGYEIRREAKRMEDLLCSFNSVK